MDVLCDTLIVEEILPRLLPKSLLCLSATSSRYKALALRPDFAARYWPRAGVFFMDSSIPSPIFLPGGEQGHANDTPVEESLIGEDLAFLPGPSDKEKAYLRRVGSPNSLFVVLHSEAGLLLCSKGRFHLVHFYICNPVTWQWVALPEQPWPTKEWQSGMLTVDTKGDRAGNNPKRFQVVLFNHPMHWQNPDGCVDLRLFSSDTGKWKVIQYQPPIPVISEKTYVWPLNIGQSRTVYWLMSEVKNQVVAHNFVNCTLEVIPLPRYVVDGRWNRFIGERHGGGLRYAHSNSSVLEVWDSRKKIDGTIMWMRVHRVQVTELLERNPEATDFLLDDVIKPVCFHPTNDDVVFLGTHRAVTTYSIENGTLTLKFISDYSVSYSYPSVMFPYVHPQYPMLIPAIKNSIQ